MNVNDLQVRPNLLGRLVIGDAAFEQQEVMVQEQALGPLARGVADRDGTPLDASGERIEASAIVAEEVDEQDEKELNGEGDAPAFAVAETDAVRAAEQVLAAPIAIAVVNDGEPVATVNPVADTADQSAKAKRAKRGLAD